MDKASIIKDAIEYIQELHEQERTIQAEILELESRKLKKNPGYGFEQELPILLRSKKKKTDQFYDSGGPRTSPIEVLEVSPSIPRSLSNPNRHRLLLCGYHIIKMSFYYHVILII